MFRKITTLIAVSACLGIGIGFLSFIIGILIGLTCCESAGLILANYGSHFALFSTPLVMVFIPLSEI